MRRVIALVGLTIAAICVSDIALAKGGGRGARGVSAARPYYGGGQHSTPHGGTYLGGVGPSHRGGVYFNPSTGNRYGIHQLPASGGGTGK